MGKVVLLLVALLCISFTSSSSSSSWHDMSDTPPPNILLLIADQFRNDLLDEPNHLHVRHLQQRIIQQGVRMTNAYASTPICTPSRAAILTGLSPWNHGMLGYGVIAPKYAFELPGAMNDAGYITSVIGKDHFGFNKTAKRPISHGYSYLSIYDGLGNGMPDGEEYDDYDQWFQQQRPGQSPLKPTGLGWNDWRGRDYKLDEHLHPTHWTGQGAIDRLHHIHEQGDKQPWFLKVSFHRPHSPYDPPARILNSTTQAGFKPQATGDWDKIYHGPNAQCGPQFSAAWCGKMPDGESNHTRRAYHASVQFVDEWVGKIFNTLEQLQYLNNTFVLFTSDHGDMQGDHNLWRKAFAYEGSAHIPMAFRWPTSWDDRVKMKRGSTNTAVAEVRDLLPTLLQVAQSKATPPQPLDGLPLTCLLLNDPSGAACHWRQWIDLEQDIVYNATIHWNALTDGRMKYIFNAFDGSEMFFDLTKDPHEHHNAIRDAQYASQVVMWRQRLIDQFNREQRGDKWVVNGQLQIRRTSTLYSPHYPGNHSWIPDWDRPESTLIQFYQ